MASITIRSIPDVWPEQAILDQGRFEFRRQLDDKLAWNGGYLEVTKLHPAPCRGV